MQVRFAIGLVALALVFAMGVAAALRRASAKKQTDRRAVPGLRPHIGLHPNDACNPDADPSRVSLPGEVVSPPEPPIARDSHERITAGPIYGEPSAVEPKFPGESHPEPQQIGQFAVSKRSDQLTGREDVKLPPPTETAAADQQPIMTPNALEWPVGPSKLQRSKLDPEQLAGTPPNDVEDNLAAATLNVEQLAETESPNMEDERAAARESELQKIVPIADDPSADSDDQSPLGERPKEPQNDTARRPRKYRPAGDRSPVPREHTQRVGERDPGDRALRVEVRLVFEKAGFCRISFIPRRADGLPSELKVAGSGDPPELSELQDNWYQDITLPDAAQLLKQGLEWAASLPDGQHVRFSLSGRELYVLSRHEELSGFVSIPRLVLCQEHVVLCTIERLSDVQTAIARTGSPTPALLTHEQGVPDGWVGLRGVIPSKPMPPNPAGDILNALRPVAEANIVLEGGIRIGRQTWLTGFPPCVRLHGDANSINEVKIDGQTAAQDLRGVYRVTGWDMPGEHTVWCASESKHYSIRDGAESWNAWDAYTWSLGEIDPDLSSAQPAICGVLMRPRLGGQRKAIIVPASNPILIGAAPGEIESCIRRTDARAQVCVGYPAFEPVWALPSDPLHCDKHITQILLIGPAKLPLPDAQHGGRKASAWSGVILAAARKGLLPTPTQAQSFQLWKAYKRRAKIIRRSKR